MPGLVSGTAMLPKENTKKKNKCERSSCNENKKADLVIGSLLPGVASQLPAEPDAAESCTFWTTKKVHASFGPCPSAVTARLFCALRHGKGLKRCVQTHVFQNMEQADVKKK